MAYQSVNPYNGQVLQTFNEHSDEQVSGFLDCASRCFQDKWRNATFAERASIAHKAASIMRTRADDFAQAVTLEMGKLIGESHEEVALSADIIDYYADNAEAFLAPQPIPTKFGEATIESTPLGVLLGIEPWNFPYYQLARFVAPSLMAGNVVMVKHASSVPQCAMAFERAFTEAGAPDGVYTNLLVSKNQLARLIQEPRVRECLPAVRCGRDQDKGSGQPAGCGARTSGATVTDAPPLQAVGFPVNSLRAHVLTAPSAVSFTRGAVVGPPPVIGVAKPRHRVELLMKS